MWSTDGKSIFKQACLNHAQGRSFPDRPVSPTQPCSPRRLILGVFFDGTDNNMYSDWDGAVGDGCETNVVRLYKLYRDSNDSKAVREKVYIVGVGAYSENVTLPWAKEMLTKKASDEVGALWFHEKSRRVVGIDFAGLINGTGGRERVIIAYRWAQAWCQTMAVTDTKVIDVYGFSRGAAMARTFVNLVNLGLRGETSNVVVRFLGVFDTVGSFGEPGDDIDVGQNMGIQPNDAAVIRHFVASHELRYNFPLTNLSPTVMYTGSHSDVGGGYKPGDGATTNHLAFVPLADMYKASVDNQVEFGALELPDGVDVEAIRAEANLCYPPGSNMYDSDGDFVDSGGEHGKRQRKFWKKYVHVSHGAYITGNRREKSGVRRTFKNKKKALRVSPPSYQWWEE